MNDAATVLHPAFGWLLVLLPLVLAWWLLRLQPGRRASVGLPTLAIVRRLRGGWAVRLAWLPALLRAAGLAVLLLAAARPRIPDATTRVRTEGISVMLVLDRSGSMRALDFHEGSFDRYEDLRTRLDVVLEVARDFVVGDEETGGGLPGRPDDLVGVVSFATTADALVPLTLDHAYLARAIRDVTVSPDERDQATAIGDAIALGVERLQQADRERRRRQGEGVPDEPFPVARGVDDGDATADEDRTSRVMILLTDGESNAGDIEPLVAAEMAAAFGIRIYTIGIGSGRSVVPVLGTDPFRGGPRIVRQQLPLDVETLRAIADRTGGRSFLATDPDALRDVYATIDELERTELDEQTFVDWREVAVEGGPFLGVDWPPLVLLGAVLVAVELVLRGTRLGAAA